MKSILIQINEILSEWNPIGVPDEISQTEYTSYVPRILECLQNEKSLDDCLVKILFDDMGFTYDKNNPSHIEEIVSVVKKIELVYEK